MKNKANEHKCYKIIAPLNEKMGGYVTKPMYDDHPQIVSFRKYLAEPKVGDYISISDTSINIYFFENSRVVNSNEYDDYRGYEGFENLSTKEAINKYLSDNKNNLLEVSEKNMFEEISIRYDIQENMESLQEKEYWRDECISITPEDTAEIEKYNQQISTLKKTLASNKKLLNEFTKNLSKSPSEERKPSLSERIASAEAKQSDANVGKDKNIEHENER